MWSEHLTECKGGGPDSAASNEVPAMVSIIHVVLLQRNMVIRLDPTYPIFQCKIDQSLMLHVKA